MHTQADAMSDLHVLLQTDLVDSTRIAEQLGDEAWAALSEAHDRVARDLLPAWRGREIDKSDGFLLLFSTVDDAVGYAVAYHRAIAGLAIALKARAGIHAGSLVVRDNSVAHIALGAKMIEVEGVAKPLTARVMAIAAGGQTLITEAARGALLTMHSRVRSQGHWRMKGLAEPIELFEVGDTNAAFAPPADSAKGHRVVQRGELWVPRNQVRHSLPAERDSFVGRRGALLELARRYHHDGARLATVVGIGGTGKTRLAVRFGWNWIGDYPGGVWFCDLAQATSLEGIVQAVALGLDVPLDGNDPLAQLGNAIAGRDRCLVILDNFEQVVHLGEATLGHWLNKAAAASFLVTSREPLGVPGEHVLALDPLDEAEASALFLIRAAASSGQSIERPGDRVVVGRLMRLLDGLPLAIELAAARIRLMSPTDLLARLSERYTLLESKHGRSRRHATLRSMLDWSWDLLTISEKLALAQVSVFESGFSLGAAEAVVDFSGLAGDEFGFADVLQALIEKSLIRRDADERFSLLVTVRSYAAERLCHPNSFPSSGPGALKAAEERHWTYFGRLGSGATVANRSRDVGNVVAACRRATSRGLVSAAVSALDAAWEALLLCGLYQVALQLADAVEAIGDLPPDAFVATRRVAGSALQALGRQAEARTRYEPAMAMAGEVTDRLVIARLYCAVGEQCAFAGHTEAARTRFNAALQMSAAIGERQLQCQVLNNMGSIAVFESNWREARSRYEQALAIARDLGDATLEAGVLGNLGTLHYSEGDRAAAETWYLQALEGARAAGHRPWEGSALCNLGMIYLDLGRLADATVRFDAALALSRDSGHLRLEATVLCNLGMVAEAGGDLLAARSNFEASVRLAESAAEPRMLGQFSVYLGRALTRLGLHHAAMNRLRLAETYVRAANDEIYTGLMLCALAEAIVRESLRPTDAALTYLEEVRLIETRLGASAGFEVLRERAAVEALLNSFPC